MTTLNLTARVLAKFPARVLAGVGMLITKANGVWTIAFNSAGLATQPVTDPANTEIIIEMPDGSLAKVPISSALAAASGYVEQTGKKNAFFNGGMAIFQRTTSDAAVTTTRKYVADRWAVKTGAGTLTTVAQGGYGNGSALHRGYAILQLTGNAGVTTVDVDQRLESKQASISRVLYNQLRGPVTFSALIYNNTGGAFTPTLFVSTPAAADNWATPTVINGAGAGDALQSCPNGAETRVFWSADISGYANWANGLEFRLRIPSGSLDVNTKEIRIGELQLEPRVTADNLYTLFEVESFGDELARCQRYYYKSFPYGTAPAQNAGVAGALQGVQVVGAATAQPMGIYVRFPVVMRSTPNFTAYNPSATNGQARNITAGADCSGIGFNEGSDSGFRVSLTTAAGSAAGQPNLVHIAADAEL